MGGDGYDTFNSLKLLDDGGFTILGVSSSTKVSFGNNVELQLDGRKIVYARYNCFGIAQWAQSMPENCPVSNASVVRTSEGGVCSTGYFGSGEIDLGNHIMVTNDERRKILSVS